MPTIKDYFVKEEQFINTLKDIVGRLALETQAAAQGVPTADYKAERVLLSRLIDCMQVLRQYTELELRSSITGNIKAEVAALEKNIAAVQRRLLSIYATDTKGDPMTLAKLIKHEHIVEETYDLAQSVKAKIDVLLKQVD